MNDDKKKQIRRTHYDTMISQKKLREIIKNKIQNNTSLNDNEKEEWDILIGNAFLSLGTDKEVFLEQPDVRISFGSVHTFALQFLDWTNPAEFEYKKNKYYIPIKKLWNLLYKHCLELFPYALGEAIHMSKEVEEKEKWEDFKFSAKKRLENETIN